MKFVWQISGPLRYLWPPIFQKYLEYWGQFWTYWKEVCQSYHNGPIWKIFNFFLTQNSNSNGVRFIKNANSCIWCPILWAVLKNRGLPISPLCSDLKIFQLYLSQNQNSMEVCIIKKIAYSCIWGPTMRAVLNKCGVGQSAQTGPISIFKNIFPYKIKIQRGIF